MHEDLKTPSFKTGPYAFQVKATSTILEAAAFAIGEACRAENDAYMACREINKVSVSGHFGSDARPKAACHHVGTKVHDCVNKLYLLNVESSFIF